MKQITITDPALIAELKAERDGVEIIDPAGTQLGTFTHLGYGKPPPGYVIPISDEELDRRRGEREGRPLADIMNDLRKKYPEGGKP